MNRVILAALLVTLAAVAVAPTAEARPDLCRDYGVCVYVCAVTCPNGSLACIGFSTQIPVCVGTGN